MPLISDNFHKKKLKDFGINIKTKYFVGNKVYERNTDDFQSSAHGKKSENAYTNYHRLCLPIALPIHYL